MKLSFNSLFQDFLMRLKREDSKIKICVTIAAVSIPSTIEAAHYLDYFITVLFVSIICILILFLKKIDKNENRAQNISRKSQLFEETENNTEKDQFKGVEIGSIVQYFLNLYRTQLNVSSSVPSRYFRSAQDSKSGFHVYELRVFKNTDEWYTRRVTVGPIGVESGSRSNCFFATYDQNIVIKIPPSPITDFRKYCSRIELDRKTASMLEPIKSITPSISWVMNKAMPQSENEFLNAEQVENRYFHILKTKTSIHDFLKIEKGFVYFMELSENYFLDQALRMIHDTDSLIKEEIKGYAHLVLEPPAFQGRYGTDMPDLPYQLSNIFKECEYRILFYAKEKGVQESLPPHIIKGLFYGKLSGKDLNKEAYGLNDDTFNYIDKLISAFFEESKSILEDYHKILQDFVTRIRKKNLAPVFSSVITNSVNLLIRLRERKIALRDLKPDNLFLDGKKDEFPQFLKNYERFDIGLIDLETAIDYSNDSIPQPMLAGTPNYATPSHLFLNEKNTDLFGDLGTVFYMQDWHAITAMIYRIVTFDHLFSDTSRHIFEIQGTLARKKDGLVNDDYMKSNSLYWKSALKEFGFKMLNNDEYFSLIRVRLTDISRKEFIEHCLDAIEESSKYISDLVINQPFFSDKSKRSSIINSSSYELEQGVLNNSFQFLKEEIKWEFFSNASEFIRFIIVVKKRVEWYVKIKDSIRSFDKSEISVFNLLVLMFGETIRFFDNDLWKRFYLSRKFFKS